MRVEPNRRLIQAMRISSALLLRYEFSGVIVLTWLRSLHRYLE